MNELLREIFDSKEVKDKDNNVFKLHSHINVSQGEALQAILREIKPKTSLEIGLAYGISSQFILEEIESLQNSHHIIIDPYPDVYWNNIGLENIKRAGYSNFVTFYKDFSYNILPRLYFDNLKIDFAFIDSTKVFDIILVDFFYIDKILNVGGVIVFDDVSFPGIRKVVRFIAKNPNYRIFRQSDKDKISTRLYILRKIYRLFIGLSPFKRNISCHVSFESDEALGVNYHCVGFVKLSDDNRNWDWFERF